MLSVTQRNLRTLRRAKDLSQHRLDELAGVAWGRTHSYETGVAEPSEEFLQNAAPHLGVDDWREIRRELPKAQEDEEGTIEVPYWGTVPCGEWEAPSSDVETVEVPAKLKRLYGSLIAVKVTGESMAPLYLPGDIVPIKQTKKPADGIVTLVQNEHRDLTLKIARLTGAGWEFHSLNPKHGQARGEQITMIGVAVLVPERYESDGIRA